MTNNIQKVTFNRREGAAYLGIAENTLVKLLNSGVINHLKVGRRILIPKKSLDEWLLNTNTSQKPIDRVAVHRI